MKENFIHVCFVIDESGSMCDRTNDVIGGFRQVIDEQKAVKNGTCAVSYFTFESKVKKHFIGKDINEVEYIDGKYRPGGLTALFDGVGTAIDSVGKWIDGMDESEKPEKNLIVIMTDGGENDSSEYTGLKIKEMIKHQEEKYNWTFIYMGSDLTTAQDANSMGISTRSFSSKANLSENYAMINSLVTDYRVMQGTSSEKYAKFAVSLKNEADCMTKKYAKEINIDANDLIN